MTSKQKNTESKTNTHERVKSDRVYQECLHDFTYGVGTMMEIAERRSIPYKRIAYWHNTYDWRQAREEYLRKKGDYIFQHTAEESVKIVRLGLDNAKMIAEFVNENLVYLKMKKLEDKEDTYQVNKRIREYVELAKLANIAATAYRSYSPDISAETVERITKIAESRKEEKKDELQVSSDSH